MPGPLDGKVWLVAGASRGVARGLGEAGATVVVSGRSTETGARSERRAETIEAHGFTDEDGSRPASLSRAI